MLLRLLAILLVVIVFTFTIYSLHKRFHYNNKVLKGFAVFLIVYKTIEIGYGIIINNNWAKYPVEYSTIFYFFFPIIILLNNKKLLGAAVTGAFVSGGGYLISLIFTIPTLYHTQAAINNLPGFFIGMLSHSILFYLSVMYMAKQKFNYKQEILTLNAITITIAVHAAIMGTIIDFKDYYLLIMLITSGDLIPYLKKGFVMMSIYFVILFTIYNIVVIGVYYLNSFLYKKYSIIQQETLI